MKLIILLIAVVYSVQAFCQYSVPQFRRTRFTVSVKKNQTGHWVTQIQLADNPLPHGDHTEDFWKISVDHEVAKFGNENEVSITIIAEPTSNSGVTATSNSHDYDYDNDNEYELFPCVGYYKLHEEFNTWDMAHKICEREGAHLAIINSIAEVGVMESLIKKSGLHNNWYFIGFHKNNEGHYVTILGEPLNKTGYTTWADGEPNNHGGKEECGSVTRDAKLNDMYCTTKMPFICEKE